MMAWRLEIREPPDSEWYPLPWRFPTPQQAALAANTLQAEELLTLHKYGPWKLNDDGTFPRGSDRKQVYYDNIKGRVFPAEGWATHYTHHCGDNVYRVCVNPLGFIASLFAKTPPANG